MGLGPRERGSDRHGGAGARGVLGAVPAAVLGAVLTCAMLLGGALTADARIPDILGDPAVRMLFPSAELADITGYNGARTYLFIGQNSYEIRPTGGFASRVGLVRFVKGDADFIWLAYTYDLDQAYKAHLAADPRERVACPPELEPFGLDSWYMRDRNFWPDFPTSARALQADFTKEARVYNQSAPADKRVPLAEPFAVHGVIAADESVGSSILGVTGSVTLDAPGEDFHGKILTSANFGPFSQWWEVTKHSSQRGFFDTTAKAIRLKMDSAAGSKQSRLALTILQTLAERHTQMYSNDRENQAALVKLGWSGKVPHMWGDYLHVSDYNVGGGDVGGSWRGNKVNMYVRRTIDYRVDLGLGTDASSTVDITYYNGGRRGYFSYLSGPPNEPNVPAPDYSIMEDAHYRAWSRAFVPRGAYFKSASWDHQLLSLVDTSADKRYWSSWVGWWDGLDPGETQHVVYRYRNPSVVRRTAYGYTYRIYLQKQAGSVADRLRFRLDVPDLWVAGWSGDGRLKRTRNSLSLDGDLRYDKFIVADLVPGALARPRARVPRGREMRFQAFVLPRHVKSPVTFELRRRVRGRWILVGRLSKRILAYSGPMKESTVYWRTRVRGAYRVRARFPRTMGRGSFVTKHRGFVVR